MNCFIEWPEAYTMPVQETSAIVNLLIENMFAKFDVRLDQGKTFELVIFFKM